MKKVLIFHHNDLDGMGVKIIAMQYAMENGKEFKTFCCSYSSINRLVEESLKNIQDIDEIIIGDISVNEAVAEKLDRAFRSGLPIRLRDHHATAEYLNQYEWARVSEKDENGVLRCGTWMLAQDEDFIGIRDDNDTFVECVDLWDTWKWKGKNEVWAKNLNALFHVMGEELFTEYIMELANKSYYNGSWDEKDEHNKFYQHLFTKESLIMLRTYDLMLDNQVKSCEKMMYTMNLWVIDEKNHTHKLNTGIIFCTQNISEVADRILTKNTKLDVLMIFTMPSGISWRTRKNLPVALGDIAKLATGKGGGHPQAAGSVISIGSFKRMMIKFFASNFEDKLTYSKIMSSYER